MTYSLFIVLLYFVYLFVLGSNLRKMQKMQKMKYMFIISIYEDLWGTLLAGSW